MVSDTLPDSPATTGKRPTPPLVCSRDAEYGQEAKVRDTFDEYWEGLSEQRFTRLYERLAEKPKWYRTSAFRKSLS